MPECRLTPQEWNQYWKQLNLAVESQDEEWIYKAKAMVKEQIRSIYTNRCDRDGKCVLCAESWVFWTLQEVLAVFDEQRDTPVTGTYKG